MQTLSVNTAELEGCAPCHLIRLLLKKSIALQLGPVFPQLRLPLKKHFLIKLLRNKTGFNEGVGETGLMYML